jgi:prepilin signal peptidase PulO-like enzyme (type II secretory pathway)
MDQNLIIAGLSLLGLCMGSFAGATVWRLRARQLVEDKKDGDSVDKDEYKKLLPLTERSFKTDRSQCLHCHHELRWYDLVPLASWLSTKGKCRYCHISIGIFEPLIELGVALLFVGSYLFWPHPLDSSLEIVQLGLWLTSAVLLTILFTYDLKWSLLPDRVVVPLIIVGGITAVLSIVGAPNILTAVIDLGLAVAILSGLYFVLWLYSKGTWIGFGDVKLGLALAFLVADWQFAFLTLFLANLIGCLIVIPSLLMGRITRQTHIPFGPLLIVGCVISLFFGETIISWYFGNFM